MKAIVLSAFTSTAMLLALPAMAQNTQNSQPPSGQPSADIRVQQPAANVEVQQPAPEVTVTQPAPEVSVEQPKPTVTVDQPKPDVTVEQQGQPNVTVKEQGQPNVKVEQIGQAQSGKTSQQPTMSQGHQAGGSSTGASTMSDNQLYGMNGSEIIGQNVYGTNGEEIGEVDNVVIRRGTDVLPAVVVGVGGFLGLGERKVAIPLDQLRMEDDRLVTNMTRDEIAGMQAYDQNSWDSWDANRPVNEAMNR